MSKKVFSLDKIGEFSIYKRKGTKKVSIKIVGDKVKVSQPPWLPYATGIAFVKQNAEWIEKQMVVTTNETISSGQSIGKKHTVNYINGTKVRTLVKNNQIDIYYTNEASVNSELIQLKTKQAIKRALTIEAKELVPARLNLIANEFDYEYNGLVIKPLKTRWGSCSSAGIITINCYLMMMPWEIIDYVLLHELTHTKHLHHKKDFWDAMDLYMPDNKQRKKQLKELQVTVSKIQI